MAPNESERDDADQLDRAWRLAQVIFAGKLTLSRYSYATERASANIEGISMIAQKVFQFQSHSDEEIQAAFTTAIASASASLKRARLEPIVGGGVLRDCANMLATCRLACTVFDGVLNRGARK